MNINNLFPASPDTLWTRTFGTDWQEVVGWGDCIVETPDISYMIVGDRWDTLDVFHTLDIYLIKVDKNGNLIWENTYGYSGTEEGQAIVKAWDDGYIIVGYTDSVQNDDIWLFKIDEMGNFLWEKLYGDTLYDVPNNIKTTSDSGYIISGRSGRFPNYKVYLLKIDINGDTLWTKKIGYNQAQEGYDVVEAYDGGFIVVGWTGTVFGAVGYIIKTDITGNVIWERTYGEISTILNKIRRTPDSAYIIIGQKGIAWPNDDIWLLKINDNGDTLWTKTYGGNNLDGPRDVRVMPDSGFVIVGFTRSYGNGERDVWIIRIDKNGDTLWTKTIGGDTSDLGYSIQLTCDTCFIIAARTSSFGAGGEDFYIIKMRQNIGIREKNIPTEKEKIIFFNVLAGNSFIQIKINSGIGAIRLFDLSGRRREIKFMLHRGFSKVFFNQKKGIYFLEIKEKGIKRFKLILIK